MSQACDAARSGGENLNALTAGDAVAINVKGISMVENQCWDEDPEQVHAVHKGRQYQVVYVDKRHIKDILNLHMQQSGHCICLSHDLIPVDCLVIDVFASPERRALGIVVAHPSFAPVLDSCEIPVACGPGCFSSMEHRLFTVESRPDRAC